jgi:protein tyrosine/serine phosphatase
VARSRSSKGTRATWPAAVGNIDCPISGRQLEIFQKLRESPELDRFSYVDTHLLRGGQPTIAQLADLKALGVTTIISLRKENFGITMAERAEAHRLGLKFLHFPFYGIFGASRAFLERILAEMRDPANGMVYLHCQRGRDRSSLLVALHLVIDHAWDPELAWRQAVLEYGYRPSFWYRRMGRDFEKMVAVHKKRVATPSGAS